MTDTSLHRDSLLAHAGGGFDEATGGVVPPIQPATTFVRDANYDLVSGTHLYSRDDNDLYRKAEGLIAQLEGAEDARLFSSGMAGIAALVRMVRPGGVLLVQSGIYWGSTLFIRNHCERSKVRLVEIDTTDRDTLASTITREQPDLVLIETPSNPYLGVTDIAAAAEACKSAGSLLAVDGTPATPLLQRPLELGADLSFHSATKALNGHSDVLGGVISTANKDSDAWAYLKTERHDAGAVMGSFEAWLLLRGLRTLALRVERMNANAAAVATYLASHPKVAQVLYPGLATHPGHEVAKAQMNGGFGSLLSFLVKGTKADALTVTGALGLFQRATSLGGVESLVEHRDTVEGGSSGVPETLLRLSVGIEHDGDLIADLEQALAVI